MTHRTSLPVVGVKVYGENSRSVDAFALLDTGSDEHFALRQCFMRWIWKEKTSFQGLQFACSMASYSAREISDA